MAAMITGKVFNIARLLGSRTLVFRPSYALSTTYTSRYKTRMGCYGFRPESTSKSEAVEEYDVDLRIEKLVRLYRSFGHRKATVDPLGIQETECRDIDRFVSQLPQSFLNESFPVGDVVSFGNVEIASGGEIVKFLENTYCQNITIEMQQVCDHEEQQWLGKLFEQSRQWTFPVEARKAFLVELLHSMVLDNFLAKKFPTLKRYSGEGAESMLAFFAQSFEEALKHGIESYTICMAHRGRSNLLTGLLDLPPAALFSKIKGNAEFPKHYSFSGDVLSHLTSSATFTRDSGLMRVSMLPNPSHLEAVNPVAMGKARGVEMGLSLAGYGDESSGDHGDKVLVTQVHGDAAFCGQGINMECLALSQLPHFNIGGSIHLITNNQIGFTTPTEKAKSSRYVSDIGKMVSCPVIRVNGDFPEEVARACRIATEYRMKYRKDIIVDMVCYRKWGHNELDNPSLTQPVMYRRVNAKEPVPVVYAKQLINEGVISQQEVENIQSSYTSYLSEEHVKAETYVPDDQHFGGWWKGLRQARNDSTSQWNTGCDADLLRFVGAKSVELPQDFNPHPSLLQSHCNARTKDLYSGSGINWATAEALAFGSLLLQGHSIRICGQDVGRGTFSHRHAMMVDQHTEETCVPLNNIDANQPGKIEIVNSLLAEEAVLAFEYGFSIENPKNLVIWEAQFGDFFNTAQVIVDTFVATGEVKWMLQSGLVMLLPHGFDGAGPEHSSCRIERFLQMTDSKEDSVDTDNVNMEVVNPTTAAQYFHLLRRQLLRDYRKPLIVASPKMILRLKAASSTLTDMAAGTSFKPVLGDDEVVPSNVKKIIYCSGKHFYALSNYRSKNNIKDTAIIRLESLCPFPAEALKEVMATYPQATDFVWSQEEQRNAGAWSFVRPRFENLLNVKLRYAGRPELAACAVGVGSRHAVEAEEVVAEPFKTNPLK